MASSYDVASAIIMESNKRKAYSKKRRLKEAAEFEDEVVDTTDVTVDTDVDDTIVDDGNGFEETIDDDHWYCTVCNKSFISSPDTPDDEIECPVCHEKDFIIYVGNAADALLDDPENEDVRSEFEEMSDEEKEEHGVEDVIDTDVEIDVDEDMGDPGVNPPEAYEQEESTKIRRKSRSSMLDESSLNEGLTLVARRYIGESCKVKVMHGKISEGTLTLSGIMAPGRKPFNIVIENWSKARSKKTFVVEAKSNLFRGGKFEFKFIREGRKYSVKSFGYGLIKESKGVSKKITGIVG